MTISPAAVLAAALRTSRARPTTRRVGFALGPLLGCLVYLLMPDVQATEAVLGANPRAAAVTLGLIVLMGVWWMLEVVPLPVTALLPLIVFPLTGVNSVTVIAGTYANKVIFLFLGGFMLAMAMQRWNLHRHVALRVVLLFGTRPTRLVFGFMLATTLLGMWVSNTAISIMMLSIGASMVALLRRHGVDCAKLSTSLMVGIAYSASISAFGTIIASPPNALLVGYLSETYGIEIGFGQWMLFGVPISLLFLVVGWFVVTKVAFRSPLTDVPGGDDIIRRELAELGPLTTPQYRVIGVFALTVAAWVGMPLLWPGSLLTDEVVAMIATVLLFVVPSSRLGDGSLLTWQDTSELPWGILLLFGGGLALASQIAASGLSAWLANSVSGLQVLPLALIIITVCALTMLLTEFMSNTASAATLIPIMAALAVAVGVSPLALALPVTLAASCAFMMPACTPPNAIAVGSGLVRPAELLRAGWMMSLFGMVLIPTAMLTLVTWVLGL